MIWASNFSIGVNAFFAAVQRACDVLKGQGYKPHVEEIHHIHKLDAPSGTAKSIAALIADHLGETPEIGAQRIGEVPGTHTAEFLSDVASTSSRTLFCKNNFLYLRLLVK